MSVSTWGFIYLFFNETSGPQLFKRWIIQYMRWITIHWSKVLRELVTGDKLLSALIVIYPVSKNFIIQLFNNWGQNNMFDVPKSYLNVRPTSLTASHCTQRVMNVTFTHTCLFQAELIAFNSQVRIIVNVGGVFKAKTE